MLAIWRTWRGRLPTALVGLALLVGGCAGERPAFLPPVVPEPVARPSQAANPVSAVEAAEHARLVAAFGGVYRAPGAAGLKRMVEDITAQLQAVTPQGRSYEVTFLNSSIVNAFALPNGRLYLTRGLLALANDKAELASVIAHEIAHVIAQHALERAVLQQRAAIVSRVVSDVLADPVAGAVVQARSQIGLASFSRQQELEADELAVRASARAGFDPYGAARFLQSLGRSSGLRAAFVSAGGSQRGMDLLATHPGTAERIQLTIATARQIASPGIGRRDADAWVAALDGLSYGEDPRNGTIRGRRYVNPTLGVAFEAPQGLSLEASSEAVLGVGAGGGQAMRFDSVRLAQGQTLETYVASGWIEGIAAGPIQRRTIGGLNAAITTGQGRDWHFRLAAIEAPDRTYRLIFASKGNPDATDALFERTLQSFRVLTTEQRAAVRPLRLRVVTARAGETAATLAGQMAVEERALEQFRLLNGLEAGADVVPGRRYKIVAN